MILSEKKNALAVCAWITGGGAALAVALSIRLLFGGQVTPLVEHTTISLCALAVVSWLVTMLLMTEITRATRGGGQISAAWTWECSGCGCRYLPGPGRGCARR